MIRRVLKRTSKNKKLHDFIKKYKIPREYFSTNRKMVSRAVLLGIFIAFIPMPFQMVAVMAFVPFFRFNVIIGLAMCWFSNPFTMPPMYYMEYVTGSFFLGSEIQPVEMTLEWFSENLDDIFIPLYVGTLFYATVGSTLAFLAVNYFWHGSVHRDRKINRRNREK